MAINTTITENLADIDFQPTGRGGGIFQNSADSILKLVNSTVTNNRARDTGGGLNNNGLAELRSTIIANNVAPDGPDCFLSSASATATTTSLGARLAVHGKSYANKRAASDILFAELKVSGFLLQTSFDSGNFLAY